MQVRRTIALPDQMSSGLAIKSAEGVTYFYQYSLSHHTPRTQLLCEAKRPSGMRMVMVAPIEDSLDEREYRGKTAHQSCSYSYFSRLGVSYR